MRSLLALGVPVLLGALVVAFTAAYVGNERTFYWSDYGGYEQLTADKALEFTTHPIRAVYTTWRSTGDDYSAIPTLPLVPLIVVLGDGRLVYIAGLALLYLLPFAFVLGGLAATMIQSRPLTAILPATAVALLTPAVWLPALRGYPDAGGALLIGLALLIYVRDVRLSQRRTIFLIALLVVGAILFRRHFAYAGIALVVTILVHQLPVMQLPGRRVAAREEPRVAAAGWWASGKPVLLLVATLSGLLATLGAPFLYRVLTEDFGALYASYEVPPWETLAYFLAAYGWITWLLAGLGYLIGIRTGVLERPVALRLATFGLISLIQWMLVVGQLGEHYPLHLAAFVVPGLVGLAAVLWRRLRGTRRRLALAAGAAYLILNLVAGLAPLPGPSPAPLLAANAPPLRHPDHGGVIRLLGLLHRVAEGGPVYVAGSSELFGCSVLTAADRAVYGAGRLAIQPCLHIDSRDAYPIEELLQASFVVIGQPAQYHLAPAEQDLVRVVVEAFRDDWGLARDFVRLPDDVGLAGGEVRVSVYRRLHPTDLAAAAGTLARFQREVGVRPGGQLDWISLASAPQISVTRDTIDDRYEIDFGEQIMKRAEERAVLYVEQPPDVVIVSGRLELSGAACPVAGSLRLDALDAEGEATGTAEIRAEDGSRFEERLSGGAGAAYLLLTVGQQADRSASCKMKVLDLVVSSGAQE